MKTAIGTGRRSFTALTALGLMTLGFLASADVARAAEERREFVGEVVKVGPNKNQVTLNVPDGGSAEGKEVVVWVDPATKLQGVNGVSELKPGAQVRVQTKKHWFFRQWVAERLVYDPPKQPRLTPVDSSQLHQLENKFAHGEMGDVEYETKRQLLEK